MVSEVIEHMEGDWQQVMKPPAEFISDERKLDDRRF